MIGGAAQSLLNGLIAYYPLQGNGNDLSGNGNNATVNNATPTTDRFGNSNGALFFNGTNAYLEAAHQQYLNTLPITISCWFSRADTTSKGALVGRYVNQSWNGYHLSYGDLSGTNSVIPFYARNYGNDISDGYDSTGENPLYFSKPITDTNWHLATMTVDTSGSTLYIDGVADTNHAWRGAPMVTTTTTPLKIGAQLDPSGQQTAFHFHGSLSDIRIYNRALGSNEVAGLYGQSADDNRVTTDTFGSGSNQFSIDFVTVGNPGNSNDTTGYGGVPYEYLIGKYTISQNQIDAATRNGLQNVTAGAWSGDQPAAPMQWFEAAAYVNWLNTSQGYRPAYNLTFTNGAWSMALWPTTLDNNGNVAWTNGGTNLYRNANCVYFLPSENEWYKAAYYDPAKNAGSGGYWLYPTGSDSAPTAVGNGTTALTAVYYQHWENGPASVFQAGGLSPYGTMGQGGNFWQWEESSLDGFNDNAQEARGLRGGAWGSGLVDLQSSGRELNWYPGLYSDNNSVGFRVARKTTPTTPPITSSTTDTFGTGSNQFTIDFVTIGNPGNSNDTTGYGGVPYSYRIGKYTISQNQVDAATRNGLQNVTAGAWSGDQPAANVSWYEAAAYVNWLNTSSGSRPAYNLTFTNGAWSMSLWPTTPDINGNVAWTDGGTNLFRNANCAYFLPSENEWYKAAYFDLKKNGETAGYWRFATASDFSPVAVISGSQAGTAVYCQMPDGSPASVYQAGGLSYFGTMGQAGNVWNWTESSSEGSNTNAADNRIMRGGHWSDWGYPFPGNSLESNFRFVQSPVQSDYGWNRIGFRVASRNAISGTNAPEIFTGNGRTVLINTNNTYVGYDGSGNSLVITNGAVLQNVRGYIGTTTNSSNNSVVVTGSNSTWINSDILYVGNDGSYNNLVVTNGGQVVSKNGLVGASNNTVVVSGSNSLWTNSGWLTLGYAGANNKLMIRNGGGVFAGDLWSGAKATSSNNLIQIIGTNSLLSLSGELCLGRPGSGESMMIEDGGTLNVQSITYMGFDKESSQNSVVVSGTNATWRSSSDINIGLHGSSNSVLVTSGGAIIGNGIGRIGLGAGEESSNNTLILSGSNSVISNIGLTVGGNGFNNRATIEKGATMNALWAQVGLGTGASNSLKVSDAGTTLNTEGTIVLGWWGGAPNNSMLITNGAKVISQYRPGLYNSSIGSNTNSYGNTVLISGAGSLWSNASYLFVGEGGYSNSLSVTDGGSLISSGASIGRFGNSNQVIVTGPNSSWTAQGDLTVGENGSGNSLIVSDGGNVTNASATIGKSVGSSNNFVSVSGAGSTWSSSGDLLLGAGQANSSIGSNALIVSNGGTVSAGCSLFGTAIGIGQTSDNLIQISGSNSTFNSSNLYIGYNGNHNELQILNGGVVNSGYGLIGYGGDRVTGNEALVSGSSSTWNNAGTVVGVAGNSSVMVISNAGTVNSAFGIIGEFASDTNLPDRGWGGSNSVTVTGNGSTWNNTDYLTIGSEGSGNSLNITGGGLVTSSNAVIGKHAASSNNSVVVSGYSQIGISLPPPHPPISIWPPITIEPPSNIWPGTNIWWGELPIGTGTLVISTNLFTNGVIQITNGLIGAGTFTTLPGTIIGYITNEVGSLVTNSVISILGTNLTVTSAELSIGTNAIYNSGTTTITGGSLSLSGSNSFSVGGFLAGGTISTNGTLTLNLSNSYTGTFISGTNVTTLPVYGLNTLYPILPVATQSIWNAGSDLVVGDAGSGNNLSVTDGALVTSVNATIGNRAFSSNNVVTVSGGMGQLLNLQTWSSVYLTPSTWSNSGVLKIGDAGAGNSLVISDGGKVTGNNGRIGYTPESSNNSVLVTGNNSLWSNSQDLNIGDSGRSNSLIISNGGSVYSGGVINISRSGAAANNSVIVTGDNSLLRASGDLIVGRSGSGNSLVISNGGTVNSDISAYGSYIGLIGSANNSVRVTGNGSLWRNWGMIIGGHDSSPSNSLIVSDGGKVTSYYGTTILGAQSSYNSLTISDGGIVIAPNAVVGEQSMSSNNSVLVSGSNSVWSNSVNLIIGNDGSWNSMVISNGAAVTASLSYIGNTADSSNNSVIITGSNSVWNTTGVQRLTPYEVAALFVGNEGSGNSLMISNGGTVNADNGVWIGAGVSSSNNSVVVAGAGSQLNGIEVSVGGWGSSNVLIIRDGGQVNDTAGVVGYGNANTFYVVSSNNSALVTGAGSAWNNQNFAVGGYPGSGNVLTISNGGVVTSVSGTLLGANASSSNNSITVTGVGSMLSNTGDLSIGGYSGWSWSGGSGNTLIISDGGTVQNANATIGVWAVSSNNSVLVSGSGSQWSNSGIITVGYAGNGTLTVAEGGRVLGSELVLASEAGSSATINYGVYGANGSAGDINVGGNVTFGAGSWTANFNQSDQVVVFSSSPTGNGMVNQLGTGTTVITGDASQFNGPINIEKGTFVIGDGLPFSGTKAPAGNILNNSTLVVNPIGAISPDLGLFMAYGGDVYHVPGVISGTGTVVQYGPGTTVLSGSNTYTGPTLVNAGNLQVTGALNPAGTVNINNSGTLSGTGSVGNATVNTGAMITPGVNNLPGTLSLQSALWAPEGNYNWVLNDASGSAGIGYSSLNIASALDLSQLSATNRFNINVSAGTSGVPLNFSGLVSTNWTIATFGSITNFSASNFTINTTATNGTAGWSGLTNGTLGISTNGNKLELTYTTKPSAPSWTPPTGLRYSALVYAKVLDETGKPVTAYGSKLAVFNGSSVAGVATPFAGPGGTTLFYLNVFASQSSVSGMTYQVYNAATGVTSTLDETYNFASGVNTGTIANPIVLHIVHKQRIPIYEGWTWISFNVIPADNSWTTLLKHYQASDNDVIIGTGGSVTYYGGVWYPSSADFKPQAGLMYMISSDSAATMEVIGAPATKPTLNLVQGWNWLGCPDATATTLTAMMPGMHSGNNDVIISQNSQMGTYWGGVWYNTTGTNFPIVPGMGYLIYVNTPQSVLLK